MFEIEIKQRLFIFNKDNISYILLGDGSIPSKEALRVTIKFNNDDVKQFLFDDHKSAQKLYDELKNKIIKEAL